ncbi:hypothetical protein CYMTET_23425 [Cymbomonas tetramitiformis]|uniref:MPN domain-containing protein n=1 Tax=Cymbomonas tetramitiformis TaxID=36881 RepID=A0AAE0L141_9CHLO|nr:hypothetical protein CYMTET_23425 [Cymbomonas tetramitiformis]
MLQAASDHMLSAAQETEDDMVNAEMDPEDQVDVRDAIEDEGLQVVGWYHSHPTFQTYPSSVDIVNQNNYQRMYQNEESGRGADAPMDSGQPFIGAIVGPYHEDLPSTNASSFQWFHVHPAKGKGAEERRGIVGMDLVVDVLQAPSLEPSLPAAIKAVITCFSSHVSRHDMTEIWREFGSVSLTRLEKLQASLRAHMPSSWPSSQCASYINAILGMLRSTGGPSERVVDSGEDVAATGSLEDTVVENEGESKNATVVVDAMNASTMKLGIKNTVRKPGRPLTPAQTCAITPSAAQSAHR